MTRLHDLFARQGQSPWIDNLSRPALGSGALQRMVERGARGVTSNPTIFQKAITATADYDEQFRSLIATMPVSDAYWAMVVDDIRDACTVLAPVHQDSDGCDGFVSLELAPDLAGDTEASVAAARDLFARVARPNLLVKIPATPEGVPAVERMVAEGASINVTLIFGLARYDAIIEAYLSGLEAYAGDLSKVHGVASFFVSRVDTEIDRRLAAIATPEAVAMRGQAAVCQAKLAWQLFGRRFSGPRWERLAGRGANVQRPLWASTSTKDPDYPDLLYVDSLIGPDTVNTMPDATLAAFLDHGTVARTVDQGVTEAEAVIDGLAGCGIDLSEVSSVLEDQGVASFAKSYDDMLTCLESKAAGA
ncbi:MAG: transaldolase [Acidimicrobiales bacterium]